MKYKLLSIQRKCLNDTFNLRKFGRNVRFEVAELEDSPIIHDFLLNEFGTQETLNKALALTFEDLCQPLKKLIEEAIPYKLSIMVIDGDELCGIIVNTVLNVNKKSMKKPKIKSDYAEGRHFVYLNYTYHSRIRCEKRHITTTSQNLYYIR